MVERAITVAKPSKNPFASGRQFGEGDQGRRELFGGRDQLAHQRVGVDRELFEAVEGQAGLVLEGREGPEQRFDVAVAGGGGPEDFVGGADQVGELAVAAAEGVEGDGAVAEELFDGDPLRVQRCGRVRRIR